MPEQLLHVVGPPGTGKTHTLMDLIEQEIDGGLPPGAICYSSFTRSAIKNARDRVKQRFGLNPDEVPFFGTLHSLCYRYLGLTRNELLDVKRWEEFCQAVNLRYTEQRFGDVDEDINEPLGEEEGDILRRWYDGFRNRCVPLDTALKSGGEEFIPAERRRWFVREIEAFKVEQGLVDFIDMIRQTLDEGWVPPVRVLILDEAQDLSPLQLALWKGWVEQAERVVLGYDEDQTIYEFQGADPRWLLEFPCTERRFLKQSFRVPRLPALIAQRIIGRNRIRYPKEWAPTSAEGEVSRDCGVYGAIKKLLAAGDTAPWFFLARNRCYLDRMVDGLREEGIPYVNLRGPTPKPPKGLVAAFTLAEGRPVMLDDVRLLADRTTAKDWWTRGAKAQLGRLAAEFPTRLVAARDLATLGAGPNLVGALSALDTCLDPLNASEDNKRYFRRVYDRFGGEALQGEPRAIVSTQHGVKGQEAPGVVLAPNMTRRTATSYDQWPEPERRVWYVGVSRTSNRLMFLEPAPGAFFDEW